MKASGILMSSTDEGFMSARQTRWRSGFGWMLLVIQFGAAVSPPAILHAHAPDEHEHGRHTHAGPHHHAAAHQHQKSNHCQSRGHQSRPIQQAEINQNLALSGLREDNAIGTGGDVRGQSIPARIKR